MRLTCLVRLLILHLIATVVLVAQDPPLPWRVDGLTLVCDEFSGSGDLTQSIPAENIDGTGWATGNATAQPRRQAGLLVTGGTNSAGSIVVPPLSALGEVTVYATVQLRGTTSGILVGWTDDVRHPNAGGAGPLVRISGDRRLTLLQNSSTSLREVVLPATAVVEGTVTLAMVYRLWDATVTVSVQGQEQVRATVGPVSATPRRYLTVAYESASANAVPALDALRVEYVPIARPIPLVSNRTITVTDTTLTGITNAIQAANQISGPANIVTVSIPRGNYTFNTPAGFTGGQLFLALGLRYIIIDWNGSTITLTDPLRGLFSLSHGNHVIVRNIASIDYPTSNLPFTQGTVRAMNMGALTFDVEIDAGFPLPNNDFFTRAGTVPDQNWGQVIDPNRPGAQAPNTGLHYHLRGPTLVQGRTFRYALNTSLGATRFGDGFVVGSRFVHCPRQGNEIFRIFDANDIRLESITGYACGNFWSMTSVGATFSYHNVRVLVKPGRLMSSNGDGVTGRRHESVPRGNRGWIEHCVFEGMGDDACNQMQADGLFVSDTIFRNTRRFGVWINGTPHVIIKDCVFDHVGRLPISGSKDPHMSDPYPFASENVLIVRNSIRSAWDDGIQLTDTFRDDFGHGADMSPLWNSYWRIVRNTIDTRIRIRNATQVRCVGNDDGAGNPAEVVIDGRNSLQVTSVGATWPRPLVTALTPEQGPTSGGTTVLLTGTGLCDTTVTVDGLRVYPDPTQPRTDLRLSLTMPAHAAGRVQVGASTFLAGSSTAPNGYTYGTLPTLTTVTPSSGSISGGTTITITGTNLTGTTAVNVGGVAATGVTVLSATSVQCVTPAHAEGVVAVVLTTAAGSVTQANGFTYAVVTQAPSFTTQPVGVAGDLGGRATFTAVATGQPSPTLRWQRNGVDIPGATSSTYTTPALTAGDQGATYRCIATNSAGTAMSLNAVVMISGFGWEGMYYDTMDFSGTPRLRKDIALDFTWGAGVPLAGMDGDTFSVRWRAMVTPSFSETYTFTATTDDGVRVWVDGRLLIDKWRDGGASPVSGTMEMQAGVPTLVIMEYYENAGEASASLRWRSASQGEQAISPSVVTTEDPARAPTFSVQPMSARVASGQTATLSATVTGDPVPLVRWQRNGIDIAGARALTYTTPPLTDADEGVIYRCIATSTTGMAVSEPARITVLTPPTITSLVPGGGSTAGGTTITITGTNLTGATAVTVGGVAATGVTVLSATSVQCVTPAHAAGVVAVVLTTAAGSVTQANAFTYAVATQAPSFTTQPVGAVGDLGGRATFTAVATGQPAPTLRWQRNGVDIPGATSSTYTTPALTAADQGGDYRCIATNSAGTAMSLGAVVMISGFGWEGMYYDTMDFSGTPRLRKDITLDFTWGAGVPMEGMDSDTFSVRWRAMVTPSFSETYTYTATTDDGVRVWIDGRLLIDKWGDGAASPVNGTMEMQAGVPALVIMEYYDNAGEASASLRWRSASQGEQAIAPSAVTTEDPARAPTFIVQPMSTRVTSGQTVKLGVTVTGEPVPLVRWQRNGVDIAGARTLTYTTPPLTDADEGVIYRCIATSTTGMAVSEPARITVHTPPTITSLVPGGGITAGGTTITITGTNLEGTTAVTVGGVAATGVTVLSATSVQCVTPAHAAGVVAVVLTTAAGSVTQANAFTYAVATQAPSFTTQPVGAVGDLGGRATFTAVATGQPAPTLRWQRNGVDIPGATSSTYTTPALTAADQGSGYRCIAMNGSGTAMSQVASVTIRDAEVPHIATSSNGGCGLGSGLGILALLMLGVVARSAAPTLHVRKHEEQVDSPRFHDLGV